MKLTRLTVANFTVFGAGATFDFAPGVNVLVGDNGTGKSHVLKLAYVVSRVSREQARRQGPKAGLPSPTGRPRDEDLAAWIATELTEVFQPDDLTSFSRTGGGSCTITAEWGAATSLTISIDGAGRIGASIVGQHGHAVAPLYLPSRELLTIYPGFVPAWLRRESAFDRTYFDLCSALGLRPLRRSAGATPVDELATKLETSLRGNVSLTNDRFYMEYGGGPMEVTMVGEGDRKIAMIAYLLRNGSLEPGGLLAWDEPEASLNPKRAKLMSTVALELARADIQVILSTHDYSLSSEIDLERTGSPAGDVAFFGLLEHESGVKVDRAPSFLGLKGNPILEAFGDLHDREELASTYGEGAP